MQIKLTNHHKKKSAWALPASLLMVTTLLVTTAATASSRNPGKVIAGWVEKISVLEFSEAVEAKAKLDTGAATSSIHAENIEAYRGEDKRMVRFDLVLEDDGQEHRIQLERERVRRVRIKEGDGDYDRRIVVNLTICFDGRPHLAEFTLTDRSHYIYPVLLGREFLEDVAVVDVEETFLTQSRCDLNAD